MARAFQLLARSEQFDWFFLSRYSADQFALGFSVQCHFTMCKLFLAAADGEQINSRNQLEEVSTAAWKVIIVSVFTFQKEGIWFGGLIKVSFSQKRQHPNPKVWNMDCGAAAAAYHDVSYPILLALEGTSPSIWHSACRRSWFWLAHKRSARWSPACSKSRRLSLSSSQKANGDCCRRSKRNNLAKKREGTISLAPFLVIYLSNMRNIYATIQHILELVERHYQW